jgi:hypothetical protein
VLNFIEPPQIRAQFKKWGFPGWFHCAVMVGVIVSISGARAHTPRGQTKTS